MTVRLSTGLRDKLLNGGASDGLKNALNLGFISIYSGPQPLTADSAASGTLLGTVSVGGAGVGLTFGNSASGTTLGTDGRGNPVRFGAIYDPRSTQSVGGVGVRTPPCCKHRATTFHPRARDTSRSSRY